MPRLVWPNPAVPWKTRGNASAINPGKGRGRLPIGEAAVTSSGISDII